MDRCPREITVHSQWEEIPASAIGSSLDDAPMDLSKLTDVDIASPGGCWPKLV